MQPTPALSLTRKVNLIGSACVELLLHVGNLAPRQRALDDPRVAVVDDDQLAVLHRAVLRATSAGADRSACAACPGRGSRQISVPPP